jgi:hypothetical protein
MSLVMSSSSGFRMRMGSRNQPVIITARPMPAARRPKRATPSADRLTAPHSVETSAMIAPSEADAPMIATTMGSVFISMLNRVADDTGPAIAGARLPVGRDIPVATRNDVEGLQGQSVDFHSKRAAAIMRAAF